ncbi:alpha/beta fold hydrolase [Hyphomicrobium sp.]|uniref:alpha/beta fold hydrolase n=1 Tax=Hyphomicrobium sp. TaxID=82 RepID=UPI003F6ECCAE
MRAFDRLRGLVVIGCGSLGELAGAILLLAAAMFATGLPLNPALAESGVSAADVEGAQPGAILRVWPLEGGVRPGYKGFRILYRSVDFNDKPLAVSGAVLFPETDSPTPRPVVAWAHPTSGVVTRCAPTLMPNLSTSIQGLDYFADAGYVIVAADYAGLGASGSHPYLIGQNAARTVLDSVRAARALPHTHAGDRFVVWGHSQGGHAALFAGAEASTYAPELKLLGVATAAPATDLIALFDADRNKSSGRSLTTMALYSWSHVFGFPLSDYVVPEALPGFKRLANDCIEDLSDFFKEDDDEGALPRDYLRSNPISDPRLRDTMEKNSAGVLPAGLPVFIAQGTADDLVLPRITRAYAKRICGHGAKVTLHMMDGVSHMLAGRDGAFAASEWIAARFKGHAAPSGC